MQPGGTSTTTTWFHVVEGNAPQEPTNLANPAPNAKIVIALTASEAGISVMLAKISAIRIERKASNSNKDIQDPSQD